MTSSPATVLLDQLADARRVGQAFDDAWPGAVQNALATAQDAPSRREWTTVLGELTEAWRAAFERRPASEPESAISFVALDGEPVAA
jgi:hypothetical protein